MRICQNLARIAQKKWKIVQNALVVQFVQNALTIIYTLLQQIAVLTVQTVIILIH